jgi:hypothetical protein
MSRPEKPITTVGPVAELARALREVRARAGGPPYWQLAEKTHRSRSVLAAAASGANCPTWEVTAAFITACEEDPEAFESLWAEAHEHEQVLRRATRTSRPKLASVRRLPSRSARSHPGGPKPIDPRLARGPDPWSARTAAEYRHLLRELRAWGGKPGTREVARHTRPGEWVTKATFYGALNPGRPGLPSLGVVRPLVRACDADLEEWVSAWRVLSLREFDEANPRPITREGLTTDPGRDGTVHVLGRPTAD